MGKPRSPTTKSPTNIAQAWTVILARRATSRPSMAASSASSRWKFSRPRRSQNPYHRSADAPAFRSTTPPAAITEADFRADQERGRSNCSDCRSTSTRPAACRSRTLRARQKTQAQRASHVRVIHIIPSYCRARKASPTKPPWGCGVRGDESTPVQALAQELNVLDIALRRLSLQVESRYDKRASAFGPSRIRLIEQDATW